MQNELSNHEVALRSRQVLDLGRRQARLIFLAGMVGVVLLVVASLVGNRPETIGVDKLLHFGGYATLAAVFVLSLSPRWYLPVLGFLAGTGLLVELVQPLNWRTFDLADAAANSLGVLIGAAVGLGTRLVYGYIKTELAELRVEQNLLTYAPGDVIVREGQRIEEFFIIKKGVVSLFRENGEGHVRIARATAGEMFGLLEEILHEPVMATVVAETAVELYQTDYDRLIADAGGRDQPLGVVLADLALDLQDAWENIAALEETADTGRRLQDRREWLRRQYIQRRERHAE
jgi:CRP-like cAMP-binding protein